MVKLNREVAIFNREGVYHARLRRLGNRRRTDNYLPILRIDR